MPFQRIRATIILMKLLNALPNATIAIIGLVVLALVLTLTGQADPWLYILIPIIAAAAGIAAFKGRKNG